MVVSPGLPPPLSPALIGTGLVPCNLRDLRAIWKRTVWKSIVRVSTDSQSGGSFGHDAPSVEADDDEVGDVAAVACKGYSSVIERSLNQKPKLRGRRVNFSGCLHVPKCTFFLFRDFFDNALR
jgi:hypothetical protein